MLDGICTRCGSDKMVPDLRILDKGDGGDDLEAVFVEKPAAFMNKVQTYYKLRATICGACGFTEIFAENHETLFKAYERYKAAKA